DTDALPGRRPSAASQVTDFPQPDSPTRPTASPRPTSRSMPCSTLVPSKATVRLRSSTRLGCMAFRPSNRLCRIVPPTRRCGQATAPAKGFAGAVGIGLDVPVLGAEIHREGRRGLPLQFGFHAGEDRILVQHGVYRVFAL